MKKSSSLPWTESPPHLEGMTGNAGFDPWGLSTPQNIKWMREAELKHGRMCMLAWTGYVVVDLGAKFPGERYAELTSYTAHDALASYELFFALLLVGTAETIGFSQVCSSPTVSLCSDSRWFNSPSSGAPSSLHPHCISPRSQIYGMVSDGVERDAGDFGFDPLGLLTPETNYQYRTSELLNGRTAMLAFAGVVTQSGLPDFYGYGKATFPYF